MMRTTMTCLLLGWSIFLVIYLCKNWRIQVPNLSESYSDKEKRKFVSHANSQFVLMRILGWGFLVFSSLTLWPEFNSFFDAEVKVNLVERLEPILFDVAFLINGLAFVIVPKNTFKALFFRFFNTGIA